jgi:hypothetical protein
VIAMLLDQIGGMAEVHRAKLDDHGAGEGNDDRDMDCIALDKEDGVCHVTKVSHLVVHDLKILRNSRYCTLHDRHKQGIHILPRAHGLIGRVVAYEKDPYDGSSMGEIDSGYYSGLAKYDSEGDDGDLVEETDILAQGGNPLGGDGRETNQGASCTVTVGTESDNSRKLLVLS